MGTVTVQGAMAKYRAWFGWEDSVRSACSVGLGWARFDWKGSYLHLHIGNIGSQHIAQSITSWERTGIVAKEQDVRAIEYL